MRRTAALGTAVLLALALVASSCGLVDSTSPFGIDNKDYSNQNSSVNGLWVGKTAGGGDITFQIGSEKVTELKITHVEGKCNLLFEATTLEDPVVNGVFTVDKPLEIQGRIIVTGRFPSGDSSAGTYFFEGIPASVCPTSASGTFTAEKTLL